MKTKIPIPIAVLDRRELCLKSRRKLIFSNIESHFIFSVIWGNSCFISENSRPVFFDFFSELLEKFLFDQSLEKAIFANGLLSQLDLKKHGFMDYFYDMHESRWILWRDTKLPDYPIISNNFHANLDYGEMVRLNPLIADVQALKKFMAEKDLQMTALPNLEEPVFVVNDIAKKCKFFLDFLIGYNRFFLVTSSSQAGKTTVIKYKIKKMLEQNVCKVIALSLTGNTTAETVIYMDFSLFLHAVHVYIYMNL